MKLSCNIGDNPVIRATAYLALLVFVGILLAAFGLASQGGY